MIPILAKIANCPADQTQDANCLTNLPAVNADPDQVQTVLQLTFGIIAAVTVLIIVIQGIRFVLSSGEPEKAKSARKGVIYAAVGLLISLSAELIVTFLLERL